MGPLPSLAPRVDVAVACEWAGRAVTHALRAAGAWPVPLAAPFPSALGTGPGAALVYDLSPWDGTAIAALQRYTRARTPVLLYLPPSGPAFTTLSDAGAQRSLQLQIQSRDEESLEHLERAARALVAGIPRVRIMSLIARSLPGLSSAAFLFGHRALSVLGSGRRPTVGTLARALGFSPRTLQRRFAAEGLPSPKAFLDWLTLAHVYATAECHEVSPARAAARASLTGNDLYRLRRRVGRVRGGWGLLTSLGNGGGAARTKTGTALLGP